MSLFNSLGSNQRKTMSQHITPQQAMAELQADPVGVLGKLGLNIPAGMNNPQQITQHLFQSGQVSQGRFLQSMQQMMGRR